MSAVAKTMAVITGLPGTISANRKWLYLVVAAYFLYKKLKHLMRSKHTVLYRREPSLKPDPALFPQYLLSCQGLWLHQRIWTVPKPRALIFLSHGFGEHTGRYEHIARALNREGCSVYGLDHAGHGLSEGDRAYVEKFDHYVTDFIAFIRFIQKQFAAPLPVFLLGHSMGGAIAVQVARRTPSIQRPAPTAADKALSDQKSEARSIANAAAAAAAGAPPVASPASPVSPSSGGGDNSDIWPWNGVILSAPLLVPDKSVATPIMKSAARWLSSVLPKFAPRRIDARAVSRYQSVVENYRKDPLVFKGCMSVRWGWEVIRTTSEISANFGSIRFPFVVAHGTADRLVDPDGSKQLFNAAASIDKSLLIYSGHYHELFNDLNHEKVTADVVTWINTRIA